VRDYDYGRVQSLLEQVSERALSLRDQLQAEDNSTFDAAFAFSRVCDIDHDLETAKRLLKTEVSSRR
jgi:hypothetical protein